MNISYRGRCESCGKRQSICLFPGPDGTGAYWLCAQCGNWPDDDDLSVPVHVDEASHQELKTAVAEASYQELKTAVAEASYQELKTAAARRETWAETVARLTPQDCKYILTLVAIDFAVVLTILPLLGLFGMFGLIALAVALVIIVPAGNWLFGPLWKRVFGATCTLNLSPLWFWGAILKVLPSALAVRSATFTMLRSMPARSAMASLVNVQAPCLTTSPEMILSTASPPGRANLTNTSSSPAGVLSEAARSRRRWMRARKRSR
jgi:hypothetical protein